jgi:hypothetical protein
MMFGAAAPADWYGVAHAVDLAAQTPFTQPQVGTIVEHRTVVQTGSGGVGAVFARQAPQQSASARKAQSLSVLQAFGLPASTPPSVVQAP